MNHLPAARLLDLTGNNSVLSRYFALCVIDGNVQYDFTDGKIMFTLPKNMTHVSNYNNRVTLANGNNTISVLDQTISNIDQYANERLAKHCIQSWNMNEYNGVTLEDLLNCLNVQNIDTTQFYVRVMEI